MRGWGKNNYKPKEKGKREGKRGKRKKKRRKRERKRRKRERKRSKEEKRKKKGKGNEIGKMKEKDGFWLTQENKQNLFGEKNHIFSSGGKNIIHFRDVNVFKIWSKMLYA